MVQFLSCKDGLSSELSIHNVPTPTIKGKSLFKKSYF